MKAALFILIALFSVFGSVEKKPTKFSFDEFVNEMERFGSLLEFPDFPEDSSKAEYLLDCPTAKVPSNAIPFYKMFEDDEKNMVKSPVSNSLTSPTPLQPPTVSSRSSSCPPKPKSNNSIFNNLSLFVLTGKNSSNKDENPLSSWTAAKASIAEHLSSPKGYDDIGILYDDFDVVESFMGEAIKNGNTEFIVDTACIYNQLKQLISKIPVVKPQQLSNTEVLFNSKK